MEKTNILYIVILYNQKFEDTNVYISLLSKINSIEDIYIWDNSISHHLNGNLSSKGYNYIFSDQNRGVSYPYNRGLKFAVEHSYDFVTFLDQDTYFPKNYILVLRDAINKNPNIDLFCPNHILKNGFFLSPVKMRWNLTKLSSKPLRGKFSIKKYAIINSGMTVRAKLYLLTGGYNELVFLDYSDFEFVKRCSKFIDLAFCLDVNCVQDFSNNLKDQSSLFNRFKLFCKSLRGCDKNDYKDFIGYHLIVLKRTISLALRLKSIEPFKIYYRYYL